MLSVPSTGKLSTTVCSVNCLLDSPLGPTLNTVLFTLSTPAKLSILTKSVAVSPCVSLVTTRIGFSKNTSSMFTTVSANGALFPEPSLSAIVMSTSSPSICNLPALFLAEMPVMPALLMFATIELIPPEVNVTS